MNKRRELLAAGLVKDYRFRNHEELEKYIYELMHKKIHYGILEKHSCLDGTVLLRICVGYNQTPLIQLYE